MKKTEIVLFAILLISFILNFFFIRYTDLIFLFTVITIWFRYMIFGYAIFNGVPINRAFKKEAFKDISTRRIWGGLFAGTALGLLIVGASFKLMYWKGSYVISTYMLLISGIIVLICIIKAPKYNDGYYPRIMKRLLPAMLVVLALLLIPSIKLIELKYRNYPYYVNAIQEFEKNPTLENHIKADKASDRMFDETGHY